MAQQKQKGGKSGKKKAIVIAATNGKNAYKTRIEYLKGPKGGGPTIAERAAHQMYAAEQIAAEAKRRSQSFVYRYR